MSSVEEPIADEAAAYEDEPPKPMKRSTKKPSKRSRAGDGQGPGLPSRRRRMTKSDMDWYILKVQSNRERSIRRGAASGRSRSKAWTATSTR